MNFLFYVIFKVIFCVFLETLCVSNLIPDSTCVRQDEKYKFKQWEINDRKLRTLYVTENRINWKLRLV